jgi:hypothetical protein
MKTEAAKFEKEYGLMYTRTSEAGKAVADDGHRKAAQAAHVMDG